MRSRALTRVSLALCVLSSSACADILGLGDFTFGDGGNTSTSSAGGNGDGGNGAAVSDGGTGGTPVVGGMGGDGGSGGMPNTCNNPVDYPSMIVCDAPILYLRFEENDTSNPMKNDSPAMIVPDGVYSADSTHTPGVAGIGGSALQQGAGRSEVTSKQLGFEGQAPYSIEAWVLTPVSSTGDFAFIGTWDGNGQGHALFVFPSSPNSGTPLDIEYKRNAVPNTLLCSEFGDCSLVVNQFQHIVATYNPALEGEVSFYLDGNKLGTKLVGNDLLVPGNAFAISGPGSDYVAFDELALYDYVLTDAQVLTHYQCGNGNGC